MGHSLSISIVTFDVDANLLKKVLHKLQSGVTIACQQKILGDVHLNIVDNGHEKQLLEQLAGDFKLPVTIHVNDSNIGFGRAHNMAILSSHADFHLVLNPDVIVESNALIEGIGYLAANPGVNLVAPSVCAPEMATSDETPSACSPGNPAATEVGAAEKPDAASPALERHHLCRRYPSLFDLFLRGFMPSQIKKLFSKRLAHYEYRELPLDQPSGQITLASGCFMLCRTRALQHINGFSDKYFLYFEDYDLSLRLGNIVYLPAMQIIHYGGGASRKGLRHIRYFIFSAITFFRTHGWSLM